MSSDAAEGGRFERCAKTRDALYLHGTARTKLAYLSALRNSGRHALTPVGSVVTRIGRESAAPRDW